MIIARRIAPALFLGILTVLAAPAFASDEPDSPGQVSYVTHASVYVTEGSESVATAVE